MTGGKEREYQLQPGINFTNRAELKYARAAHIANELRGRIDEWSASEPVVARVHVVSPHEFQMRAVVRHVPPVDEWSLIAGDAIHNLRSAFDNLMWGLANLDGAQPRRPTKVAFPLTSTQEDWRKTVKNLESVPPVIVERLQSLQPWVQGVPIEESLLWLLHHFDIVDKHRGIIDSSVRFAHLATLGLDFNVQPRPSPQPRRNPCV